MEKKYKIFIGLLVISLVSSLLMGICVSQETYIAPQEVEASKPTTTQAQDVWISALEWCESRGKPSAVNKKDRDGTPSYGAFQFKPDTFFYYGEKYGAVIWMTTGESDEQDRKEMMEMVMNRDHQLAIVREMVIHSKEIRWSQQFPDCVKKLGTPPAY